MLTVAPWRWLEHAAWVIFEDVFLIWSCCQGTDEMRGNLRLFAALGFGEYVLWKIAAAFSEQHPQIAIELEIGNRSTNVLEIGVDIGLGSGTATVYTCDLTHGYIDINGSYRS